MGQAAVMSSAGSDHKHCYGDTLRDGGHAGQTILLGGGTQPTQAYLLGPGLALIMAAIVDRLEV